MEINFKLKIIYQLLFVIISSINCHEVPVDDINNQIFALPQDKHTRISVTGVLNKNLIIKIRGNKTTGYGWFVDNVDQLLNPSNNTINNTSNNNSNIIIKPMNLNDNFTTSDYFVDSHERGMTGVGGYYYFKFKPMNEGESKIVFTNKRPWDTSDQVKVEVDVKIVSSETEL